jgi:hypothetical protein
MRIYLNNRKKQFYCLLNIVSNRLLSLMKTVSGGEFDWGGTSFKM